MRILVVLFFAFISISVYAQNEEPYKSYQGSSKIDSVLKQHAALDLNQYFALAYSKYYKLYNYRGIKDCHELKSNYFFEIYDKQLPEVYINQKLLMSYELSELKNIKEITSVIILQYTAEQLNLKKSKAPKVILVKY